MPEERTQTPGFQGRKSMQFENTAGFTAWLASASGACGKTHEPVKRTRRW